MLSPSVWLWVGKMAIYEILHHCGRIYLTGGIMTNRGDGTTGSMVLVWGSWGGSYFSTGRRIHIYQIYRVSIWGYWVDVGVDIGNGMGVWVT